jgi:hypothetical protein
VKLVFDFQASEIRTRLYLAEGAAQRLLLKLRQQGHEGAILASMRTTIESKLERTLLPHVHGGVRIIHPDVPAQQSSGEALKRLPAALSSLLRFHLLKWMLQGLEDVLKTRAKEVQAAIEAREDGISFLMTIHAPPGLDLIKDAFAGRVNLPAAPSLPEGQPKIEVKVASGHVHV